MGDYSEEHATREKAYTVWNQKTGARATNYGSRVDFILAAGPRAANNSPAKGAHARQPGPAAGTYTAPELRAGSHASGDEPEASSRAAAETAEVAAPSAATQSVDFICCRGAQGLPVL